MILKYIKDNKEITKHIVKFWQGLGGIKFQLENGQMIEIDNVHQCYIYEMYEK